MMSDDPKFDFHQHYGAVPGAVAGEPSSIQADCARRIEFLDSFGISGAAIMPGHTFNGTRGFADVVAINDGVAAYGALAPHRFPALFGTLDPRHGEVCLGEVERVHSLGLRGLSWHHRFQGLPIDHPMMMRIAGRMSDLGMVGLFHCYANGDFESPWRLRRLAESFPQMTFCALDAMTSPENLEQLLAIIERCGNVYIDLTTTILGPRGVTWAVERVGADKLLFGSNFYSMSRLASIDALDAINRAGLTPPDRRAILHDNARKLLGL